MSVDLKSNRTLQRVSIILTDDALWRLEHAWSQDRVRRLPFESIEGLLIWWRVAWLHAIVCAVVLLLPGILLLMVVRDHVGLIFSAILAAIGLLLVVFYTLRGRTTLRLLRSSGLPPIDITGIFSRRKVRLLRDRLIAAVPAVQQAKAQPQPTPAEPLVAEQPTLTENL